MRSHLRTCASNLLVFALPLAFAAAPGALVAQQGRAAADRNGWRLVPEGELRSEYDNNVFLLRSSKKDNLDPNVAGGRYAGMESASDIITTAEGVLRFRGSGIGGRRLELSPHAAYEFYAANAERRNLTFGVTAEQSLGSDGRVRVTVRSTPEYFAKNYLSDAVDGDASGTITNDERVYSAGTYSETNLRGEYRRRLLKTDQGRLRRVLLDLGGGYSARAFDAPFEGRDLSGPSFDLGLHFDLPRKVDLGVEYEMAALSATATRQVQLLDEPDFNRDFNGNGSQSDLDVRTFEVVDRSRTEHSLGVSLRLPVARKTDFGFAYARRLRNFGSDQPFDAGNRGRNDARNEFDVELERSLRSGLRLVLRSAYVAQSVNRSNDAAATGDVEDYTRVRFLAALTYRF